MNGTTVDLHMHSVLKRSTRENCGCEKGKIYD